jgi:hypothetical protein
MGVPVCLLRAPIGTASKPPGNDERVFIGDRPPHQIDDVPAATAEQQFTIAHNEVLRPNAFAFHKK